jgi:hypothetical protein
MALAPEKSLVELRNAVMERCVLNTTGNLGARAQKVVDSCLNSAQRVLYYDHDYTRLQVRRTITLSNGVTTYDFPDDIEPGQIFNPIYVRRLSDQRIFPLRPGINWMERNAAQVTTTNSIPCRYTFENEMLTIAPAPDTTLYDALVYDAFLACTPLVGETDLCTIDSEALIQMAEIMVRPRMGLLAISGADAILAKYLDSLKTQSGDDGDCLLGGATSAVVTPEGTDRLVRRDVGWDEGWQPSGIWS